MPARTHGNSSLPEYYVWKAMRQRCNNPNNRAFKNYGGRGITTCPQWNDFSVFLTDLGRRPSPRHTLERRNNDVGYSKQNCYWATRTEQSRNHRRNRMFTYNGETMCVMDWATHLKLPWSRVFARLNMLGWSIERALELE